MRDSELNVHRKNTRAFILQDPVEITLMRRVEESDGAGGKKKSQPVPVSPQTFRLIPANDQTPSVQTLDGVQRTPTYVLLAEWDADIALWDEFEFNGHRYQIASPPRPLHTDSAYERKGDVVLL